MKWRSLLVAVGALSAGLWWNSDKEIEAQNNRPTATPIEHIVVIFGENVSFDHYFGTYPNAANIEGQPQFKAAPGTPAVNGLTEELLTKNPNFLNADNAMGATNPFRLDRSQAAISGQNHSYRPEQQAFNGSAMDSFPRYTGIAGRGGTGPFNTKGLVMGYFDGNTVTAMWNYAQRFALNDNSFNTTFGPSTPGAINLISGQTNGAVRVAPTAPPATTTTTRGAAPGTTTTRGAAPATTTPRGAAPTTTPATRGAAPSTTTPATRGAAPTTRDTAAFAAGGTNPTQTARGATAAPAARGAATTTPAPNAAPAAPTTFVEDGQGGLTMIGDPQPAGDACSNPRNTTARMTGKNIGDLLNEKGVTWGWFQGGFDLTAINPDGSTGCQRRSYSPVYKAYRTDYVAHHQPFQYYASTANPQHTRPASVASIGTSADGGANHQYDLDDFFAAVRAGNFPAVSFLKAQAFQDAHPGNSDPLDEQAFVVKVVNFLQRSPEWKSTAVILAYDDSDGWYDHVQKIVNPSFSAADALNGAGKCGSGTPLPGLNGMPVHGRCGYGPRLPLLVISPYAKVNFVDHTLTDQTSILRFIEDNWLSGQRIGQGSFDALAGPINNMFDFDRAANTTLLLLDPETGLPRP
jgi:phospholipase C